MRHIHSSPPLLGAQATRKTPARAAQSIPATHFRPHFVVGGGDCLFQALCMGSTNQPDVPVSMEHIMGLRQDAANYVAEHRSALIAHPSLGGEAGVNALYGLLITQGQWNENAGDLVPPILARVLGREIRILEPTQHDDSYGANENRIFRPQDTDTGLPPAKPDTGQPPIYLAHINNAHYEYLEPRAPQADTAFDSIEAKPLPDSIASPYDSSSSGSTSTTRWVELLLNEEENGSTDDVCHSASPQGSSFVSVSSLSSLESYSSRGFLEHFTAEEKNNLTGDVGPSPRKRPRNAELRPEQENKMARHRTGSSVNEKQVATQIARSAIKKAFTKTANNRPFQLLTKNEQDAEVLRISQETGYRQSGVRTTLSGRVDKQVASQPARNQIKKAFTDAAHDRTFEALTKDEQTNEVVRISEETGYRPSGVRATLNGEGNRPGVTLAARTQITNAFSKTNNRSFESLTQDQQDAEVMRISRQTEYRPSVVRATLNGEGTIQVTTQLARTQIVKEFTEVANNRLFATLTQGEQRAEVARISRKTGYSSSGVRTTLTRVTAAKTKIMKEFIEAANNRTFEVLTENEQYNEVLRISKKTGHSTSDVLITLIESVGSNTVIEAPTDKTEIMNAFHNEANNRPFETLTLDEQYDEVLRISQATGHNTSDVLITLIESVGSDNL